MARLRVTALTQHRATHREHAWVIGAVRVVAITAILGDRRVFPKIRSALLGVTIKAGVIKRLLRKLKFACCTVSAMAAAAVHFALADWMRVRF